MKAAKTSKNLKEMPGIKMSWVENQKVNNWGWGWMIIQDSGVLHKQRQMPQFHKLLQKT